MPLSVSNHRLLSEAPHKHHPSLAIWATTIAARDHHRSRHHYGTTKHQRLFRLSRPPKRTNVTSFLIIIPVMS
ncbi:hypothetical protein HanIR_Chr05g0222741 [Helianthus annuus]|nr:hypothetical protein HanIR_Chr05g0222741 [Helianthus annuus]